MPTVYPFWRLWFRRAFLLLPSFPTPGDRHHFVREYRHLVRRLKADYPLDDAMSLAVGGSYVEMGERLTSILADSGSVKDGVSLLDLGCGSGRLPAALSAKYNIEYMGIDIIPELLYYARLKSPSNYTFVLNRSFNLPVESDRFDVVCAFSLFTHLGHEETFAYLAEARRALRPGGRIIFSFLEFEDPSQWGVFKATVDRLLAAKSGPANIFIERNVLTIWAEKLGFSPPVFIGAESPGPASGLGQTIAIMILDPASP